MLRIVFISLILFAANNTLLAQNPKFKFDNKSSQSQSLTAGKKQEKSKSEQLADKIINSLKLADNDARMVRNYCQDRAEKIEKIRLNSDNTQQKINDLQSVNSEFDNKLKYLLSPAQFAKYEQIK